MYALLSVFDKTGIVAFVKVLHRLGYALIATGGTAKTLLESDVAVIPIEKITGNPESFDGRLKTISFQVEAGILFDRSNPSHVEQAKELHIKPIDIVVCNLYPFEQKPSIENIDVGGPTMIRAAAKNYEHVLVVVDPKDYQKVETMLKTQHLESRHSGERSDSRIDSGQARMTIDEFRRELAAKAFAHLSLYDALIAQFLERKRFPKELIIPGRKCIDLRYGENPHQQAALYTIPNTHSPFDHLKRLLGRELSLTNVTDINAGLEVVRLFSEPTAVIIKHNSPCGIALGDTPSQSLARAIEADPESAFGGVVVLNKTTDRKTAEAITRFKSERKSNIDIVAAPGFKKNALTILRETRKSMGVYTFGKFKMQPFGFAQGESSKFKTMDVKWVDAGFILQTADTDIEKGFKDWEIVTKKKPTKKQLAQMQLAWKFISRIRSNAVIVVDRELPMTRGIGTGQTSRVRATRIALEQAGEHAKGAVLASDSFFPFPDSVELAQRFGISAVVQQGGSVNDKAVTTKANRAGIAMVFTHRRAFWH